MRDRMKQKLTIKTICVSETTQMQSDTALNMSYFDMILILMIKHNFIVHFF